MKNVIIELENMKTKYEESEAERRKLEDKNSELAKLVAYYEECLRLSKHRQFGQSSEKADADSRQILLVFDEVENEAVVKMPEPSVEEITYTRRRCTGKKEDDFDSLPIEKRLYSIPEEGRTCPECGGPMHVMGHDKRRELTIIPAQVKIVEHEREVYSCRRCERENIKVPVIKAPMPEATIKGSAASASSIAHIMVQKYMNGVPLYRQEQSFLNDGFFLSRQTMSNWLIRASSDWLEPLYEQMRQGMLKEEILHADETVVQVLKEPGRSPGRESFMWLYCTGRYTETPTVLYEYQETRSSAHPRKFLESFKGYLHTDGYSGYKPLQGGGIHLCGCWAHARRKFHEAVLAAPPEERTNCTSHKGLEFCDRLFALEREYEQLTPEERHKKRLEQSKPVSDAFFAWASSACALPKSALGKALHYALGQKPYLETFYLDGRLELSNNRAERSIKPFVIGRKNWLFCCTPKGAKTSSVIYSIIETAKKNRLKPFEYLKYIFETMPNIQKENYHTLLPWSKDLPDSLRLAQT